MRVLMVLKYMPSEFADRKGDAILTTVRAHEEAGFEVVILTTRRKSEHGWDDIDVKTTVGEKSWLTLLRVLSRKKQHKYKNKLIAKHVIKYHERKQLDLVFAYCTAEEPALIASYISNRIKIPLIIREHRNLHKYVKSANDLSPDYRYAVENAERVLAVSPQLADYIRQIGLRKDVSCLPNGISEFFFKLPSANHHECERESSNCFVFAAWTNWRDFKRLDLLIEAFDLVREKRKNVKLVIAGNIIPPRQAQEVKRRISDRDLKAHVVLCGERNRTEIHQLAHSCDCCVISSDFETFGLSALEAMAAGKPVVATKCGGPESIIVSDRYGLTVEKGNSTELGKAMLKVHDSYGMYNRQEIQKYAYDNYSTAAISCFIQIIYKEMLDSD